MFIESRRVLPWFSISLSDEFCPLLVPAVERLSRAFSPSTPFDEVLRLRATTVFDSSTVKFAFGDNVASSSLPGFARRLLRPRCVEPTTRYLLDFSLSLRHPVPILGPGFNILAGYSQGCNVRSQIVQPGSSRPLRDVVSMDAGIFLGLWRPFTI